LIEDRFDPHEEKTDGISIERWNITINILNENQKGANLI